MTTNPDSAALHCPDCDWQSEPIPLIVDPIAAETQIAALGEHKQHVHAKPTPP